VGGLELFSQVSLPDLPEFPISTPVPYTLHVVTETKTLDRSDRPEDKHGKPLFPVPPTQPSDLFRRNIEYTVQGRGLGLHREKKKDIFNLHRSQALANTTEMKKVRRAQTAPTQPMEPAGEVHTITDEPEWVPKDDKERGIWRRSVRFTSTLAFPFAPTSTTETLRWSVREFCSCFTGPISNVFLVQYTLLFTISFPGIGNDLKLEVPVHLGPASACPPPPTGAPGSSNLAYADILPAGPPPMLDLPPCVLNPFSARLRLELNGEQHVLGGRQRGLGRREGRKELLNTLYCKIVGPRCILYVWSLNCAAT
jgi:hypothetical protein